MKKHIPSSSAQEQQQIEDALQKHLKKERIDPRFFSELRKNLLSQHVFVREHVSFFLKFNRFLKGWLRQFFLLSGVLIFGMASTYAYISPEVNRENNLYFLKRTLEEIELGAAFSDEKKTEKFLKMADRRLEEVRTLSKKGIIDTKGIEEMRENTKKAEEIVAQISEKKRKANWEKEIAQTEAIQKNALQQIVEQIKEAKEPLFLQKKEQKISAQEIKELIKKKRNQSEIQEVFSSEEEEALPQENKEEKNQSTEEKVKKIPEGKISNIQITEQGNEILALITVQNTGSVKITEGTLVIDWGNEKQEEKSIEDLFPSVSQKISFTEKLTVGRTHEIVATFSFKESDEISLVKKTFLTSAACTSECIEKSLRCTETSIQSCEKNTEGCFAWKEQRSCGSGLRCENLSCVPLCTDTCQLGVKRCNVNGAPEVCGKSASGCTTWQQEVSCNTGFSCSAGSCQKNCSNECTPESKSCAGEKEVLSCQKTAEGCYAWREKTSCGEESYCEKGQCHTYPPVTLPPGWDMEDFEKEL